MAAHGELGDQSEVGDEERAGGGGERRAGGDGEATAGLGSPITTAALAPGLPRFVFARLGSVDPSSTLSARSLARPSTALSSTDRLGSASTSTPTRLTRQARPGSTLTPSRSRSSLFSHLLLSMSADFRVRLSLSPAPLSSHSWLTQVPTQGRGRGRGGAGGGRGGAATGGGAGGGRGPAGARGEDRPKREAILDLAKYVDKQIRVKFTGGREGELSLSLPSLGSLGSCLAPLCLAAGRPFLGTQSLGTVEQAPQEHTPTRRSAY